MSRDRHTHMTSPADRFFALSPDRRRVVHERLVERALARWTSYAQAQGTTRYQESVCGTEQIVEAGLPDDALAAVRSGQGIAAVAKRYSEPITAMQDEDLVLPEPVAFAYYAVYNFFRKYALHAEIDDWLIVNQACSSEEDREKWGAILADALERAL